jgi:hypothetical protein
VYWACAGSTEKLTDPGKCADGSNAVEKLERRPHGDHNPRHGGQFFMADDQWHHLEGTYHKGSPFRVYFYDDFTRAMAVKGFAATIALADKDGNDVTSVPLKPGREPNVLEAQIPGAPVPTKEMPAKFNLRAQFGPTEKMRLFNFAFPEYSIEPKLPVAVTTKAAPPAPAPKPAPPVQAIAPPPTPPPSTVAGGSANIAASSLTMSRAEATLIGQELPNNTAELLKLLDLRSEEVKTLVQDGNFGMVYVPTMMAKDVALALGDHASELPNDRRPALNNAVRRLVLSAWRLDQYGDLGNREKISDAHGVFTAAVADIKAAYAQSR